MVYSDVSDKLRKNDRYKMQSAVLLRLKEAICKIELYFVYTVSQEVEPDSDLYEYKVSTENNGVCLTLAFSVFIPHRI